MKLEAFVFHPYSEEWGIVEQNSERLSDDAPDHLPARSLSIESGPIPSGVPRHKLGGLPEWIQSAEVPGCPSCGEEMEFVIQLDSDPSANLQFDDDGMLYSFICRGCVMLASVVQSY